MKTLTKREKVLLYVLLCIVLVVGGVMLCIPALESHTTLKAKNETLDFQIASLKASIVDYGDLDKKIEEATKEYEDQIHKFYFAKDMKAEDVDALVTQMAIDHNLTPLSLQISEITEEEIINYKDFIQKQATNGSEEDTNTETTTTEEKAKTADMMKVYNVSLKVKGTISSLQALVNDANQTKSLKVNGINYSEQKDDLKEMSVTFKIFMI